MENRDNFRPWQRELAKDREPTKIKQVRETVYMRPLRLTEKTQQRSIFEQKGRSKKMVA